MSKLATIQNYRRSPAAGGIFSFVPKLLKGGLNLLTGGVLGGTSMPAYQAPALNLTQTQAVRSLTANTRTYSGHRRKGTTGKELSGFHKVSRLLHKEGMVSKKARRG
jgi:hypothetical protein